MVLRLGAGVVPTFKSRGADLREGKESLRWNSYKGSLYCRITSAIILEFSTVVSYRSLCSFFTIDFYFRLVIDLIRLTHLYCIAYYRV